jgi:arylsulfatase A-like enzyme
MPLSKQRAAFALAICTVLLGSCAKQEPGHVRSLPARPYNIVLIVIDTLRADHLGTYGYTRDTSPFIDSLASSGVLFERATAPSSYTGISIASLFSGRLPSRAGIHGVNARAPADSPTIAERLQSMGYRTALATRHPMVGIGRFTDGFDRVEIVESDEMLLSTTALEMAGAFDGGPFFLYAHYFSPHAPYEPPQEFHARFSDGSLDPINRKEFRHNYEENIAAGHVPGHPGFEEMVLRYDAEIAFTDHCIQTLIDGLRDRGLLENTIVVLTSDHGEEFFEHGYIGHAWTLYEEVTHVPLVLWSEDLFHPARVSDRVSLVDVVPTLWSLLGVDVADDPLDGAPFLRDVDGRWMPDVQSATQIAELHLRERVMVRSLTRNDWKYITASVWKEPGEREDTRQRYEEFSAAMIDGRMPRPGLWDPPVREELFNLAEDPTEQQNLLDSHPQQLAELREILDEFRRNSIRSSNTPEPIDEGLSEDERRRLEALGYL